MAVLGLGFGLSFCLDLASSYGLAFDPELGLTSLCVCPGEPHWGHKTWKYI